MQKPSKVIDDPRFWKALWAVVLVVVAILGWAGKTLVDSVKAAWDAQAQIQSIKSEVLEKANKNTSDQLLGYVTDKELLQWQLKFEREERARDREKLEDLQRLLKAFGR